MVEVEDFEALITSFENSDTKLWEVFSTSDDKLVKRVNRSVTEIGRFREFYKSQVTPPIKITATADLLSTGVTEIDDLLGGGMNPRTVVEISGPAGAGKTCLACQIALYHSPKSVYFSFEDNVSALIYRMQDMDRSSKWQSCKFRKVKSLAELKIGLRQLQRLSPKPVVVVIDSIASALEGIDSSDVAGQLEELNLRRAAYELGATIILINQVRDTQRGASKLPAYHLDVQTQLLEGDPHPRAELRKRQAHSLQVAEYITTRLIIYRPKLSSKIREVSLVWSKNASPGKIKLEMGREGLGSIDEFEEDLDSSETSCLLTSDLNSEPLTPATI